MRTLSNDGKKRDILSRICEAKDVKKKHGCLWSYPVWIPFFNKKPRCISNELKLLDSRLNSSICFAKRVCWIVSLIEKFDLPIISGIANSVIEVPKFERSI